jgi:hypothetical protein
LNTPGGELLESNFANQPKLVSANPDELIELLNAL